MIEATPRGVSLSVRVIPRAGRAGIAGTRNGALLVRLNAPPVDGAANAELIDVLASTLNVPKRAITIASGSHTRTKRVLVDGIDAAGAERALRGESQSIRSAKLCGS